MKAIRQKLMNNYMIRLLLTCKGNPRACLWPEPLWGVPYNLYQPYVSLFMTALGLSPAEIGYVASINMVSQVIFATLSGVLCDKLGRRRTTFFFDVLSWSVPEFIWMFSQNFAWFAFAAVFNGAWRVTENSWSLLLIEDMREEDIMPAFSLTQMLGLFSAFFAPLSKFAVDAFGLVPTMRVLYGITFVSMTVKFILVYVFSTETQVGVRRMEATKDKSLFALLWECRHVYLETIMNVRMLLTFGIVAAYSLVTNLNTNYWALYVCGPLGVSEGNVVLFATLKSFVTLICVFVIVPRLRRMTLKGSVFFGVSLFAGAQALLLLAPAGGAGVAMLVISAVLEAAALAILSPVINSLLFINADPEERARVCGLVYATISLIVAIFPSIIGTFAVVSLRIPFVVCLALFGFIAVLTAVLSRMPKAENRD
ncbi:MAG: MFS transporter [Eubacteriales bacterium]|nr:MFS transporter [Eubacteriales bacterium]